MSNKNNDIQALRHSAAHLLAHAVSELYPMTLLTIGPATEDGFFYDMLPEKNFKEDDLPLISARMQEIVQKNYPLEHKQISKEEARKIFANNRFKLELIDQIPGDTVGLATQGDFYDLCRGGHIASTGMLKYVKLQAISGSYWRANKDGQALQRISGVAFFTQEDLNAYEQRQRELNLYDHRRLGKQLDLFSFHDEGVGFPFFHPKGKRVINVLTAYMRKLQQENNYQEISTPTMLSDELWRRSGHYEFYHDKMYFSVIDDKNYAIKPMNCPGSILIYQTRPRSYRELPLKLAEYGHCHRHELSGVLHGLMRVRAFTQDDAHIYCTSEQLEHEIGTIIKMVFKMLSKFDLHDISFAISTRPEKYMGSQALWQTATQALTDALVASHAKYTIKEGEGAFYGPKIEVVIQDSMGRNWQCGTIQVDFFQPENFDLSYVTNQGSKQRPVIIHQAIFGSLERFFAIILEHYKGNLPYWLAPVQIKILTVTDGQKPFAIELYNDLKARGVRVEIDETSDPLSGQIKSAQLEKIPWMLVVGKKEAEARTVTIRYLDGKQEPAISLENLHKKIQEQAL
ncbi:MAG: threonine--tRNA ligase [Candidatus Babeliaceae bacterium]|nr:threonine--tRNA ligase [Candidatus Babeliaceae bacterium]